MTVSKKFWVFPCASYHAGTKSHVLSGDVMCEYVYVVLANYSCVCMYLGRRGWGLQGRVWGLRLDFCEQRSELRLFWTKFPTAGAQFSQEYYPIWCPMSVVVLPWDTFDSNSFHILATISEILWTSHVSVSGVTCTKGIKTTIMGCT